MVDALLNAVRHTPHRLLSPLRYTAAVRAVERISRPRRLLVICHGNICRSPFAEAALQRLLSGGRGPGRVIVESAGLMGPGRRPPDAALRAAHRRGFNLSAHWSRVVTADLMHRADLVIVMDGQQARTLRERFGAADVPVVLLGDFDPERGEPRAITDPFDAPDSVFDAVYARIERCAARVAVAVAGAIPARRT